MSITQFTTPPHMTPKKREIFFTRPFGISQTTNIDRKCFKKKKGQKRKPRGKPLAQSPESDEGEREQEKRTVKSL